MLNYFDDEWFDFDSLIKDRISLKIKGNIVRSVRGSNRMNSVFEKLDNIDVSAKSEKKGMFTYLSWAWAVRQLQLHLAFFIKFFLINI